MSFVSYSYFIFLTICIVLYYIIPLRFKWGVLLAASITFCWMLDVYSSIWIIITSVVTYYAAILISKLQKSEKRKASKGLLILTLLLCLGALFWVKYQTFALELIPGGERIQHILPSIAMPIGISFYIFQVTGYLVDVYLQKQEAVCHIGHYIMAITFFGKLTQGPIVPVKRMIDEMTKPITLNVLLMRQGALTVLLGLFKKAVIADRLAAVADSVFSAPTNVNGLSALIGIIFYTFQLYTDFAGYTDIAVGSALMFGMDLPHNFRQPYLSKSIADFWRRWHITLSTWFKTYVYIPLGGSRVNNLRWTFNILVVFLVSGLWHGAGVTFVFWGLLHGGYQVIGRFTQDIRTSFKEKLMGKDTWLSTFVSVSITFILVSIAWTFFRASSITDAFRLLICVVKDSWILELTQLGIGNQEWYFSLLMIFVTIVMDIVSERKAIASIIEEQPLPIRWIIYLILLFILIMFGMYGNLAADSFIYVSF